MPTDIDDVAVPQRFAILDAAPIHAHAVHAAQILDNPTLGFPLDAAMVPGCAFLGDLVVIILAAAHGESSRVWLQHATDIRPCENM